MKPKSKKYIPFLKKKSKLLRITFVCLLFFSACTKPNQNHYQFWKNYDSFQKSYRTHSSGNETYFSALAGLLSDEKEKELKRTESGNLYVELGGKQSGNGTWSLQWYPEQKGNYDYYARSEFSPKLWGEKEIYTVERSQISHWKGFLPRDYFVWLNEFAFIVNDPKSFEALKSKSQNLKFLCETMTCSLKQEGGSILLEFSIDDITKKKFPGFYNRTGVRLEKTKMTIDIWDKTNPEDKIKITNLGKTIQFHFPSHPRKQFFLKPGEIRFLGDIEIKSFGITAIISDLEYKLNYTSSANEDKLVGKYVRVGKKEITGRFLYFIPTGVIDFFIPGNIDEFFSDMMTLQVYGTQGRGGAGLQAVYSLQGNTQTNKITTYSEIMRKKFSLYGADDSQKANQDFDFYASWEEAMMKDFKGN
ncbi:LIC10025 family lipoprotein [Leptospira idonii]|uniref:LIC10025 family lipoprotein n=1 Tax=Leptospira idonii TaxID=1193500 RepID=UPI001FEB8552|nr:hypothetical protein [Leptospira idonii]